MRAFFKDWRLKVGIVTLLMVLATLMGGMYLQSIPIAIALLLGVSFILSPLIAMKKRYTPCFWLFACGPVGMVVIAFLPPLKAAKDPEEYERLENRANHIGAILSGIGIFVTMIPVVAVISQEVLQPRPVGIFR